MAEVKWVKVYTDMFDNRKIKQIETMPDGDALMVIWLKLLILAAVVNDNGLVYMTPEIPYTDQMLATEFNKPLLTVQLALNTFQKFEMIEIVDDVLMVSNWCKYQNVDGMEKIREQNRIRQQRRRDHLALMSRDSNVTVTECHATDIDIDKDIDKEIDIDICDASFDAPFALPDTNPEPEPQEKPKKHKYGVYKHVLLTDEQYDLLLKKFGEPTRSKMIQILDEYIEEKGAKYKNHYLVISKDGSWVQERALSTGDKTETIAKTPAQKKADDKAGIKRNKDLDAWLQKQVMKNV